MADKNVEIRVKNVRLSFAHLFEPQEQTSDKTGSVSYNYGLTALIPKKLADGSDNPQIAEIRAAMKQALENRWPGQDMKIPAERRCFRDGEPKDEETGVPTPSYDGYAGQMILVCKKGVKSKDSKNPLQLLGPKKTAKDEKGNPIFPRLKDADGLLYSGAYANLIVRIYGYDGTKDKNPNRINCSLEAVQFVRHGEAFGAKAVDADNSFEEEGDDGDDAFAGGASAASDDDL